MWSQTNKGVNLVVDESCQEVRNTKHNVWGSIISENPFMYGPHSWTMTFQNPKGRSIMAVCLFKSKKLGNMCQPQSRLI